MGLNPSQPALTFLLVMLHTGTMVAVIVYFWRAWKKSYFASATRFLSSCPACSSQPGSRWPWASS